MDGFGEYFWSLDQLRDWALLRDRDLVNVAGTARKQSDIYSRAYNNAVIKNRKEHRDIQNELWIASDFDKTLYREAVDEFPRSQEQRALERKRLTLSRLDQLLLRGALGMQEGDEEERSAAIERISSAEVRELVKIVRSLPEIQGPFRRVDYFHFPIEKYLLCLFRSGRLAASGNVPNEPLAEKISPENWAGLVIGVGENAGRLGVWRIGRKPLMSFDPLRRSLYPGNGDIENVRIGREQILKIFPANTPARNPAKIENSDENAREIIRDAIKKNGGFIGQDKGAKIVRAAFPNFRVKRAMALVKELTGNDKPGPRGPRKKSC
ncbi:MAG: hypothetical protein WA733_22775 [Methylocystis sp.]